MSTQPPPREVLASDLAARLGLALLFDGTGPYRRFTVVDPTGGRLGVYCFTTATYTRCRDGRATAGPVGEILTKAARRE